MSLTDYYVTNQCRTIPVELIQQKDSTTNGSKRRCILTGTTEAADIVTEWIFPPALSHKVNTSAPLETTTAC